MRNGRPVIVEQASTPHFLLGAAGADRHTDQAAGVTIRRIEQVRADGLVVVVVALPSPSPEAVEELEDGEGVLVMPGATWRARETLITSAWAPCRATHDGVGAR